MGYKRLFNDAFVWAEKKEGEDRTDYVYGFKNSDSIHAHLVAISGVTIDHRTVSGLNLCVSGSSVFLNY